MGIDRGIKNLPEPTESPIRLVYKLYVSQDWEIRLPYVGRVCDRVGDKENWVMALGIFACLFSLFYTEDCT